MSFAQRLGLPLKELVVAPMVDQSELAFRMLCRHYGAKLCYTPMLHSRLFVEHPEYREKKMSTCDEDRPLMIQFCGHDKDTVLKAAKMVESTCDAVDLNFGCPQNIARKGRYGAFLLEEWDLLKELVSHLSQNLTVPVTCKIRILPQPERTLELAKMLEESGCSLLTVHGRTKEQKQDQSGKADWEIIRKVKESLSIPVIANGGIGTYEDGLKCLEVTNADAVMSSEAILENPSICAGRPSLSPFEIFRDYLEMVEKYPAGTSTKMMRAHVFKFLYGPLSVHRDYQIKVDKIACSSLSVAEYTTALRDALAPLIEMHKDPEACQSARCRPPKQGMYSSWYDRYQRTNTAMWGEQEVTKQTLSREEIVRERALRKARRAKGKKINLENKQRNIEKWQLGLRRKKEREEREQAKRQREGGEDATDTPEAKSSKTEEPEIASTSTA
mmetsp:Transcript_15553/g.27625  ORF Transcript_15553/g.27625 Transcript_15553/m.27625 type:complete len:443 (+) Transcript_15553:135-1463(+)